MSEVTRISPSLLPQGVEVLSVAIAPSPSRSSRRQAEQLAVRLLVEAVFGPEVALGHDSHGAPYVEGAAAEGVSISVSHSQSHAWLAVSRAGRPGIDAEHPREQLRRVERRFLAPGEADADAPLSTLLALWTAKEAVFKAAALPALDFRLIQVSLAAATASIPDGRIFRLYPLAEGVTLALPS